MIFVLQGYAGIHWVRWVSVIVSRFIILIENFVICCYQVTKTFCSRCGFTSAFPAKSPCDFEPLAYDAVSVIREVRKIWLSDTTFLWGSESDSRELLAGVSVIAETLSSTGFSVNSCDHSSKSCNGSPCTRLMSSFRQKKVFDFSGSVQLKAQFWTSCTLTSCYCWTQCRIYWVLQERCWRCTWRTVW